MIPGVSEALHSCARCFGLFLCRGGSDWERIKILEVNQKGTSQEMNDTLGNVKFSATAWAPDSKVNHLLPARAWLSMKFPSYPGPTTINSTL